MAENTDLEAEPRTKNSPFSKLKMIPKKEVQFRAEAKTVAHRKFFASSNERRRLIKEVNDAGFLLYEYYLSLAGVGSKDEISDEQTAKYFGWEVSKVKRLRTNLTKAGWFSQESYSYTKGRKGITYYIGKEEVARLHSDPSGLTDSLYGSDPQWP